ncbi:MAG: ATP-binding protein [Clostridia bacterium]|nr:ATP-binding protein [Clostridia bacterium]MBQ3045465.1 ATP-binding protein [Clostridia bacterium]MBQ4603390.1 ATP-binding protein [Clostridia bacterium]
MNECLNELYLKLNSLCIFRALLYDSVISRLVKYLKSVENADTTEKISLYSDFVSALYSNNKVSLARHIHTVVGNNENVYVKIIGSGKSGSPTMKKCVDAELEILQSVADLTPAELQSAIDWNGFLPVFKAEKVDLANDYAKRTKNIGKYGYGIYAKNHMFRIDNGKIVPVLHPDETMLSDLIGYEREKKTVLDNTKALLESKPAANILLTGDAGTGKSSTVKAVVNELYKEGLRIIEVRKEQLREISVILDELSDNPLKFILFIDDLSFQKDDDNFSALKAILEGSVSAKSKNVVIYATSNRRHLVKEKFSDREGDDVHFNDTIQEIISLSDRFGIHITFNKPNKETYLDIVRSLANKKGIKYNSDELERKAEQFALEKGSRSARAAKQFVESII